MHETTRKSFYIFLTAVLGVLLFVTIQRSAFLLYYLLNQDLNMVFVRSLEILTGALAITLGAWYGVWLGLLWYRALYEDRTTRSIWGAIRSYKKDGLSSTDGEWEIDDLVALETIDPKSKKPTIEYLEAGAVKWHGNSAGFVEEPVPASKKKTHRRSPTTRKTATKKSIV